MPTLPLRLCFVLRLVAFLRRSSDSGESRHGSSFSGQETKKWRTIVSTALAAAVMTFSSNMSAMADLNKYEAETGGGFSATHFGSADLKKAVHVNENFRRANFTAADMRESDFSGSTFNGAYLEKAVAYKANFTVGWHYALFRESHRLKFSHLVRSDCEGHGCCYEGTVGANNGIPWDSKSGTYVQYGSCPGIPKDYSNSTNNDWRIKSYRIMFRKLSS